MYVCVYLYVCICICICIYIYIYIGGPQGRLACTLTGLPSENNVYK